MEQASQFQITIPSNTNLNVLTLENMRGIYRQRYAMAKRIGLGEWFVETNGTEEKWLSQFTQQSYDKQE